MNKKGFTLVELLASLIVLGIVIGITFFSVNVMMDNAKKKSEDVFVGTIRDALDVYLTSSDAKRLNFSTTCGNKLNKSHSVSGVNVYKSTVTLLDVINSELKPITEKDLVNPGNKDVKCNDAGNIVINIYKDEDYVYYYSVPKESFECFINNDIISNLPEGFVC